MFSYVNDFFASELVGCHDLLMSNKTTQSPAQYDVLWRMVLARIV